ncbi:heparinase II/III family protein [Massilia sp. S19_KUP03_FR1]|uniref:heparinase II/III family protein n=1 Tax=Massilia sp. S19_KUP03_FR1 TaxID=3025503 RepID=UPI002FCD4873
MTPRWLLNRLRCMSVAEVAHRAGRALARPRLHPLAPHADGVVFARSGVPDLDAAERAALLLEAASIDAGRVPLFARHTVTLASPPDWNAALDRADIKYTWELNRHLHLVRLAQAWALTGAERWRASLNAQLRSWLAQCPPTTGPNWTSGLELGIRLINWSLIWQLLHGQVDAAVQAPWLASIRAHCTMIAARLSRHSSANNHLIGELAGLYVAACTWPCWPESRAWRAQAQRELEEQMQVQFHADGVHREQAFAYHVFCCDFLWLAGLLGQASGAPFSSAYWMRLQRARDFTRAAAQVGANVGDADDGSVWRLQSGHGRAGEPWLQHLFPGPPPPVVPAQPAWAWPDAGYYLFGTPGRVQGMVDCGPLGYLGIAAHGHADALSLTLHIDNLPVLVDSGTYAYWREARWRDYFRGTSAHNTVRVDGLDQSVGGGRFLWLRKARTRVDVAPSSATDFFVAASHDGYLRLHDPVRHQRSIRFADNALVVHDHILGRRVHRSEIFWHFAPDLEVQLAGQGVLVRTARYTLALEASCGTLELVRGADHPPLGWYATAYDLKTPCTVLRIVNESSDVRVECRITISFFDK